MADFETKIGAQLPNDYREFLLEHNGGRPEKSAFTAPDDPLEEDSEWVERELVGFYGLHEHDAPITQATMDAFKLSNAWRDFQKDVPGNTLLPISQDTSGSYICLDLGREHFGQVCLFDHEYDVAIPLAKIFETFLETLTESSGSQH